MALSAYTLAGEIIGPGPGSQETPNGAVSFDVVYTADVSFVFNNDSYAAMANFVVEDGEVFFAGICR